MHHDATGPKIEMPEVVLERQDRAHGPFFPFSQGSLHPDQTPLVLFLVGNFEFALWQC